MITQRKQSRWLGIVVLMSLAGVLVWQVLTKSLAAYLAFEWPEMALNLDSNEPTALVMLADARLNPPPAEEGGLDAARVSQQASATHTETNAQARDRVGAWAELAIKAARQTLSPAERNGTQDLKAATPLAPLPVSDAERKQARTEAEMALIHDPLNARALRILGQLADKAGDEMTAARLMQAAAYRSWGESVAIYWLMIKSFQQNNYDTTLRYADAFLRKRPQFTVQAMPVLARVAESGDEKAERALKTLLAGNPPWRSSFFSKLPGAMTDARTPLQLLLSIKQTTSPPTLTDLRGYLNFLIGRKFYELAYYTWLQFLPPEELGRAGFLVNGRFEIAPSGLPFDWVIAPGSSGVTTDIVPRPELDGRHALYLEFGPGRADFRGVSQLLMLTPGDYELSGKYKGEIVGRRGLQWSLRCANAPREPIGESRMFLGTARTWTDFRVAFTVPDADCRAQRLRLTLAARSASERLVSGSIWYDEMDISRVQTTNLEPQGQADETLGQDLGWPPAILGTGQQTREPSPDPRTRRGTDPKVGQP